MRQALIEAAVEVVAEKGIASTTTRKIADRAGVPLGSLHYWFASKTELMNAVTTHVMGQLRNATAHPSPHESLSLEISELFETTMSAPLERSLVHFEIIVNAVRNGNRDALLENQEDMMRFSRRLLMPWRAGAEATIAGGFEALCVLVNTVLIGAWFESMGRGQRQDALAAGMRLLGSLLKDVPRSEIG